MDRGAVDALEFLSAADRFSAQRTVPETGLSLGGQLVLHAHHQPLVRAEAATDTVPS
jgi:hypothetical protein